MTKVILTVVIGVLVSACAGTQAPIATGPKWLELSREEALARYPGKPIPPASAMFERCHGGAQPVVMVLTTEIDPILLLACPSI